MDIDALKEVGFEVVQLEIKDKSEEELSNVCKDLDILFVAGGNTFYLLQEMKKSGFDKVVHRHVEQGKWYVGSSAGSVVAGSNIELVDLLDDPKLAPELQTFEGLNLVDVVIIPHWGKNKYKNEYLQIIERSFSQDLKVITLQDTQALLVQGDSYRIVQIPDKNQIAIKTYAKIAETYTKTYFADLTDAPYLNKFVELLPKNAKVLDVGSGPGQFSAYLKNKGFQVTGIDLSPEMIEIARQKVSDVTFEQMDMRRLNFAANLFDGLLVAYSLIHIPTVELRTTLKEFARILQPGGYILFITQKGEADQVISEPFAPEEEMFVNFFTTERLRGELERVELEVVFQQEAESTDPDSLSDTVIYTIVRKPE